MIDLTDLRPPFLVFPDRTGGFFVFQEPLAVFSGPDLAQAEALAVQSDGWVVGGLEYSRAEAPASGWWGVFAGPQTVTADDLGQWAAPGPVVTGALSPSVSFEDYDRAFAEVRTALARGVTYQANLTFFLEGRAVSGGPWTWRSALRLWLDLIADQGREAAFAVLGTPKAPGPVIVSASPELFFSWEGSVVEARPMKGTAARDPDPVLDEAARTSLATSEKNRAENLMVTDMLRNDLGRLAIPGRVSVPLLFDVESYPTVWQMTSTVRAQMPPGMTLSRLMTALFPCASITGAPKLSTQEVLNRVETEPRGWYTGTLGWHRPGTPERAASSRFSVLIRTLVFAEDGAFRLGVGGGVVWDSTPGAEWDEAWTKSRFLGKTRRSFSLTEALLWEPGLGYFLLDEHLDRLRRAAAAFGGVLNPDEARRVLDQALRSAGSDSGPLKVRLLLDPEFRLRAEAEALAVFPEVVTVGVAPRPLTPETLLFRRFKTIDRRVYDENRAPGVDQTVYWNEAGHLTETTSLNLVVERGGQFFTPPLSDGLLDGTYRGRLVAEGKLKEQSLTVDDLAGADQIWLVNSVRRWVRARLVTS